MLSCSGHQSYITEFIIPRDTEAPFSLCASPMHPMHIFIGRSCHPYSGGAGLPTSKQGGTSAPCRISRLRSSWDAGLKRLVHIQPVSFIGRFCPPCFFSARSSKGLRVLSKKWSATQFENLCICRLRQPSLFEMAYMPDNYACHHMLPSLDDTIVVMSKWVVRLELSAFPRCRTVWAERQFRFSARAAQHQSQVGWPHGVALRPQKPLMYLSRHALIYRRTT